MSYLDTRQACITQLVNNLPTGLTTADVAFENNKFNPQNRSLWLAAYFIPVTTEATGKTDESQNEQRGIFQVSVFAAINGGNYDTEMLTAIDELTSVFKYNTQMVYNTQTVQVLDSTVSAGSESESWYQRDITINYLTFSGR